MATGGVSVIVRARDEEQSLGRCLSSIAGQAGVDGPVELIVVDSGSRDGTVEVARRHGATIATIAADPYSYGGALNLGAERARGSVLVALSAHAVAPDQRWLARLTAPLAQDTTVACTCGDLHGPDGERLDGPIDQDEALARRRPEWGYSNAAGAFRAELWRRRGFREDLVACEDKEWALHWLARGYMCRVDPALAVEHDHTHDPLRAIYGRARREAAAYAQFLGARPYGASDLIGEWWSDLRWYDSAARARLSPRRTARLLGAYAGRRSEEG
jgi:glycosyltransferase involved in cell wall biosynthesis